MTKHPRKKVFVDRDVQGALLRRLAVFWACCMLYVLLPSLIGQLYKEPDKLIHEQFGAIWFRYAPVLIAMFVLLPCAVLDLLKLSNRFVGPLYRVRHDLRRLANGEEIEPLKFRTGDYWQDLAGTINEISAELQRRRAPSEVASEQPAFCQPHVASSS